MKSQKRFVLAVILIMIVIIIGTSGYHYIEGWTWDESLYMTFITLTTVGYGEVRPLTDTGRSFTIFFLIISILTVGYTVTTLITYIFEGQIVKSMKERRMKLFIKRLKGHFIICGFGDVGREAAEEFLRKNESFTVIDKSIEESERNKYPKISFIIGDAAEEQVLAEAKIDRARGLITCLPDDQQNVFVVLTARQMNPDLHIVSQVSENRNIQKLEKAGADRVISPKQIAGRRLASVSLQPAIVNFLDILSTGGDESIRMESFRIEKGSSLSGCSLRESNIGKNTGAIIIGIIGPDGKTRFNSSSEASLSNIILHEGDELITMGNDAQLSSFQKFLKG